jgi:hypothetical protein
MPTDEYVRLLVCNHCQTIQEVPDFTGPAEYDAYLNYRTGEHRTPGGTPHKGFLSRCKASDWAKEEYRLGVLNEINDIIGTGKPPILSATIDQEFYDIGANFKSEAMTCWKQHNRTQDCDDWRSEPKRLIPDTQAERKAEGMPSRARDIPNAWLCDFCPVNSVIQQRVNEKKGLYK